MSNLDEVEELKQRIVELERELAQAKGAHAKELETEVERDKSWGEFNPG